MQVGIKFTISFIWLLGYLVPHSEKVDVIDYLEYYTTYPKTL